jgi:Gas vesicle protein G
MFLVDDILLAPLKGLAAVCRQIEEAARQELQARQKAAVTSLAELHKRLEAGQLGEEEFDLEEAELLERLDAIERTLNRDR